MKKMLLFGLCLFIIQGIFAQNILLVIKVNGLIIAKTINKELKPGLEISSNEKFDFKSPLATASFIDPKSGKISQLNVRKNLYTPDIDVFEDRGEPEESLFSFFSDTVVFYQKIAVSLPSNLYEQFSNRDYILSILIDSKKITLLFNQTDNNFVLLNDTTQKLSPGVYKSQLCSVKKNDKSITVMSNFWLLIPDSTDLMKECHTINVNTPQESRKKNMLEFVRINYGKICSSDFAAIMYSIR